MVCTYIHYLNFIQWNAMTVCYTFSWQLYMEDIREQSSEYGIGIWILETDEQRAKICQATIHRHVLQSPVQETGMLTSSYI